ncbi:LuxR C-terminal-related transcriptional regulator [Wenyingzhuangia sp. IMCC45467]
MNFSIKYSLLFCLLFQSIYSQEKLIIDHEFKSKVCTHDLYYVLDTLKNLELNDIINSSEFKINKRSFFRQTDLILWYKLKVNNVSKETKDLVFSINAECFSDLTIYKYINNKTYKIYSIKDIKEKDIHVSTSVNSNDYVEYYFKVDFTKSTYFPLEIFEKEAFSTYKTQNQLELGFFYGISLIILLINIFFYINTKDRFYLYYSFLLLSIISILAEIDGFFSNSIFVKFIDVFLQLLLVVSLVLFTNEAIGIRRFFPRLITFIFFLIIVNILFYILYACSYNLLWYSLGKIVNTSILLIYLFLGFLLFNKHVYARFSVIGYLTLFISNILYILPFDFGIHYFDFSNRYLKMSSLFEMVVFLYAISYRNGVIKENLVENIKNSDTFIQKSNEEIFEIFTKKYDLTLREKEIVNYILLGKTNKEISEKLFIQEVTVKYHISNIFRKLDIKKRTELTPIFLKFKSGKAI